MLKNNKAAAFVLAAHLLAPLVVTIIFIALYQEGWSLLWHHLFSVACVFGGLIVCCFWLVFLSHHIPKFVCVFATGFLWAFTGVFLYSMYMLAFFGQQYNSRIFTFNILYGYLGSMRMLISNLHINITSVWLFFAIVPAGVAALYLFYANKLFGMAQGVCNSLRKNTGYKPWALALVGTCIMLLAIARRIRHNLNYIKANDPVSMVLLTNFQGEFLNNTPEQASVRKSYPKNIAFNKKNVVMVVVDALRADHLGLYGYKRNTSPFLDSMYTAGRLKKVNLALSSESASFLCLLSLLRSKSWHNISERNFSLPDLLHDQGYALNFLISGDHTHFYGLKSYYSDTFDYYMDGFTSKNFAVNDDRIIFEGLQGIKPYNGKPAYFHVHFNSVHRAGIRLPQNKVFLPDDPLEQTACYVNNYDNGIVQADGNIRKLFAALQQKGYLQNSIVVITADHGESLGEKGVFGHAKNVYTEETLIPLLIYDSESGTYANLDFATQTDIAPTLVDRLGLPIPKTWEGFSLLKPRPETYTYQQMNHCYAVVHARGALLYKYIFNNITRAEELYNLHTDIYEKNNLINEANPAIKEELGMLKEKMKGFAE